VRNLTSPNEVIVCLGDSLTEGVGADSGQDYPSVLSSELAFPVVNHGRRGVTIMDAGVAARVNLVHAGRFRRKRAVFMSISGAPKRGTLPLTLGPWEAYRWSVHYAHGNEPGPLSTGFVQDSKGRYTFVSHPLAKAPRWSDYCWLRHLDRESR